MFQFFFLLMVVVGFGMYVLGISALGDKQQSRKITLTFVGLTVMTLGVLLFRLDLFLAMFNVTVIGPFGTLVSVTVWLDLVAVGLLIKTDILGRKKP